MTYPIQAGLALPDGGIPPLNPPVPADDQGVQPPAGDLDEVPDQAYLPDGAS